MYNCYHISKINPKNQKNTLFISHSYSKINKNEKEVHMKRKVIYITLTIIWMIIIFIMSSMNTYESNGKSKQTIKKTVQKTSEISEDIGVVNSKPTEKQINETVEKLNFPLRKCAHATEYAILALLIIFVLNSFWGKNCNSSRNLLYILIN